MHYYTSTKIRRNVKSMYDSYMRQIPKTFSCMSYDTSLIPHGYWLYR
jgi:hypothetical protein